MIPERYTPITYALFRIVFGFLFLCYGLQKLLGWFGGPVAPLASLQGAAGVIETVCGLLVMVGLFTRLTAFIRRLERVGRMGDLLVPTGSQ